MILAYSQQSKAGDGSKALQYRVSQGAGVGSCSDIRKELANSVDV